MNLDEENFENLNPDDHLVSHFDEEANQNFLENFVEDEEQDWDSLGVPAGEEVEDETPVEDIVETADDENVENADEVETIPESGDPEPTPVQVESPTVGFSQEQMQEAYTNWKTQQQDNYKKLLTPDLSLKLISNPEEVLPVLLQQVHESALRDAAAMMQNMVPTMTQTNIERMVEARTNEELFFSANADLLPVKTDFDDFLVQYRSLPRNQARDFKDISQEAANAYRAIKGLRKEPPQTPPTQMRPPPPAMGGLTAPARPAETNPFAALAEEFLREDM